MFELKSENLSNLGLAMGMEYTFTNWRKFFQSFDSAVEYATKDYGKELDFNSRKKNYWTSGDLGWVMYHITKVETED